MYRLVISGKTMPMLKEKLQAAADSIKTELQVESDDVAEGYEHPQTAPVNTSPAPAAPAQTDSAQDSSLDSRGVAWNGEIHSARKSKNADGTWKYKRGVDLKAAKKAETPVAEQSAQVSLPALPAFPTVPAASPVPASPAPVEAVPVAPAIPQAPPAVQPAPVAQPAATLPPPPAMPQAAPVHSLETFKANLPLTLSNLVSSGKLTHAYIQELCTYFGVSAIYEVIKDDTKTQALYDLFVQHKLIDKVG